MRASVLGGVAVVVLAACRFEPGQLASDATVEPPNEAAVVVDAMIDATPVDARVCPPGPTGCNAFTCPGSASCYYECGTTSQTRANWNGARDGCENGGLGCLVTINDLAEQNCIAAFTMPTFQTAVWIGFRQEAGAQEPAGGWGWECGTSTYVHPPWGTGTEPNDQGGNEDCAALTGNGNWFDANCAGSARYVCEL